MPQLRASRRRDDLRGALAARGASIATRSRALFRAAVALDMIIDSPVVTEPELRSGS